MNKKSNIIGISAALLSVVPFIAFAQLSGDYIFVRVLSIISYLIYIAFGVATMIFLWGVIQYVIAAGDDKKIAAGRQYMLWGIIGLSVMVGVWGFVNLVIATVFGGDTSALDTPGLPGFGTFNNGGGIGGGENECTGRGGIWQDLQCIGAIGDAASRQFGN